MRNHSVHAKRSLAVERVGGPPALGAYLKCRSNSSAALLIDWPMNAAATKGPPFSHSTTAPKLSPRIAATAIGKKGRSGLERVRFIDGIHGDKASCGSEEQATDGGAG